MSPPPVWTIKTTRTPRLFSGPAFLNWGPRPGQPVVSSPGNLLDLTRPQFITDPVDGSFEFNTSPRWSDLYGWFEPSLNCWVHPGYLLPPAADGTPGYLRRAPVPEWKRRRYPKGYFDTPEPVMREDHDARSCRCTDCAQMARRARAVYTNGGKLDGGLERFFKPEWEKERLMNEGVIPRPMSYIGDPEVERGGWMRGAKEPEWEVREGEKLRVLVELVKGSGGVPRFWYGGESEVKNRHLQSKGVMRGSALWHREQDGQGSFFVYLNCGCITTHGHPCHVLSHCCCHCRKHHHLECLDSSDLRPPGVTAFPPLADQPGAAPPPPRNRPPMRGELWGFFFNNRRYIYGHKDDLARFEAEKAAGGSTNARVVVTEIIRLSAGLPTFVPPPPPPSLPLCPVWMGAHWEYPLGPRTGYADMIACDPRDYVTREDLQYAAEARAMPGTFPGEKAVGVAYDYEPPPKLREDLQESLGQHREGKDGGEKDGGEKDGGNSKTTEAKTQTDEIAAATTTTEVVVEGRWEWSHYYSGPPPAQYTAFVTGKVSAPTSTPGCSCGRTASQSTPHPPPPAPVPPVMIWSSTVTAATDQARTANPTQPAAPAPTNPEEQTYTIPQPPPAMVTIPTIFGPIPGVPGSATVSGFTPYHPTSWSYATPDAAGPRSKPPSPSSSVPPPPPPVINEQDTHSNSETKHKEEAWEMKQQGSVENAATTATADPVIITMSPSTATLGASYSSYSSEDKPATSFPSSSSSASAKETPSSSSSPKPTRTESLPSSSRKRNQRAGRTVSWDASVPNTSTESTSSASNVLPASGSSSESDGEGGSGIGGKRTGNRKGRKKKEKKVEWWDKIKVNVHQETVADSTTSTGEDTGGGSTELEGEGEGGWGDDEATTTAGEDEGGGWNGGSSSSDDDGVDVTGRGWSGAGAGGDGAGDGASDLGWHDGGGGGGSNWDNGDSSGGDHGSWNNDTPPGEDTNDESGWNADSSNNEGTGDWNADSADDVGGDGEDMGWNTDAEDSKDDGDGGWDAGLNGNDGDGGDMGWDNDADNNNDNDSGAGGWDSYGGDGTGQSSMDVEANWNSGSGAGGY